MDKPCIIVRRREFIHVYQSEGHEAYLSNDSDNYVEGTTYEQTIDKFYKYLLMRGYDAEWIGRLRIVFK